VKRHSVAGQAVTDSAFFRADGDRIIGNDTARGPWSADACHAGPVTGVIARAAERAVPDKQLVRLTLSFQRPIPVAGFRVDATVDRAGRAATTAAITLRDLEGRSCVLASSLHLAVYPPEDLPTATVPRPVLADAIKGEFLLRHASHGLPFFGSSVEVAYPPGESGKPGPATTWMRTPAIMQGEQSSPFQTLCPIADCGNGISRNGELSEASFINADLTVTAYRLPESDWLASSAISFWEPNGIGMSQATLFDTRGALGVALQTLIVRPMT
jgi:hypothetical protein